MKVKEVIEALQKANPEFEVRITDMNGNEYPEIIVLDTDKVENVYIVIEDM